MSREDEVRRHDDASDDIDSTVDDGETHATTGGAAAAGAVTGGVVGLAGGPLGAAIGAVGGAIVGAAAERVMHHDDDAERGQMGLDDDRDANLAIENRTRGGVGAQNDDAEGRRLELREEEVQARKTSTETGEVRLGKEVVTEERTVDVPVTREEVVIDRQPVERRVSDTPIGQSERRSIDVPVREERVTIDKKPVVYEEVGVGKREVQETRDVDATVRREELHVEREGDAGWAGAADTDAYRRYVAEMRNRPSYRGRSWAEAEADVQRDWTTRHPDTPWDRARERVRDAWESATD